jgi:excisionase family DNA binding protein
LAVRLVPLRPIVPHPIVSLEGVNMSVPAFDEVVPEPRLVSVETFSRTIGVSRSTGYNLLDSGVVRSVRFNGRRLVPAEELDRVADELVAQAK